MDKCNWTEDEDGNWHTDCGEAFFFDTGGPAENKLAYCGYCGKELVEKRFSSEHGWTLLELLTALGCLAFIGLVVWAMVLAFKWAKG